MTKNKVRTPASAPAPAAGRLHSAPQAGEPFFVIQDSWMDALAMVDPGRRWKLLEHTRDYQLTGAEPELGEVQEAIAFFFMKSEYNEETGGGRQAHFLVRESWLDMFVMLDEEIRWELMELVGTCQLTGENPPAVRSELAAVFYLLQNAIREGIADAPDVFIIRAPWMDAFQILPTEKRWHLLQYIMRYQRYGEEPDIEDQQIRMAFSFIREELARLERSYRAKAESEDTPAA